MHGAIKPYFASDIQGAKGLFLYLLLLIVAITWWPSHQLFKWLHKRHRSANTFLLSIVGCSVVSAVLIVLGLWLGGHVSPEISSLGSESGGSTVGINLMWLPFSLLSLGLWAGFLSGYVKLRVIN